MSQRRFPKSETGPENVSFSARPREPQKKKPPPGSGAAFVAAVARLTGLEPATPGVTGRYSNQLSYNRPLRSGVLWRVRALVKQGFPAN